MLWDIFYNRRYDRYAAINRNIPATTLMETGHFDFILEQKGFVHYAYGNILQAIILCSHNKTNIIDPVDIQFHNWDRGDFANLTAEKLMAKFGMSFIGTLAMETIGSELKGRTAIDSLRGAMNAMVRDWNESQSVKDENASQSVRKE